MNHSLAPIGRTRPPLAVLVAVSALQPFALNVLAPATPGLARTLGTDYATIQLTLTLYLVTVAVTQLVVGPISDRIGRRPCILAGLALFGIGSLLGALADGIGMLLLARIVQAAGGGTCFALARAVVRDTASKDESASLIGYITMAMVVSPMIAPLVGGFLDARFGWRSIFLAILAMTACVAVAALRSLHETAFRDPDSSIASLFRGYPDLIRDRRFLGYTLALSSTSATFFGFIAGAPYVVVEVMGRSPDVYAFWFLVSAVTYMVGNYLSGRFGMTLGSERLARIGLYLSMVSVTAELLVLAVLPWTPATLFIPLMLNGLGNGMTIPGGTAAALSVRPELAGTAAGLVGATQLGIGAAATILIGHFVTIWPQSLAWNLFLFVLLGWASLAGFVGRRD
jgi:DHA1 family bicyclomycin/chloramphenicol resistance-like MFS transporter